MSSSRRPNLWGRGSLISTTKREIHTPKTVEGWNLIETETATAFPALIKYLANKHEKILWIDSSNQANTHHFESRPQLLEKISIARAFTALQHHELCQRIEGYDLLVLPEIDRLYLESSLYESERKELFRSMVESLDESKILYSTSESDAFLIDSLAENRIKVEETSQGLKFSQKGNHTQAYTDNTGVQTTVAMYGEEVKKEWEEPIKHTETDWKN